MSKLASTAILAAAVSGTANAREPAKPTIVLVHGAFADSSGWNGVTEHLVRDGYTVVAAANPLRGVKADAAYVSSPVASIDGPVVLVGHSYGGAMISGAARGFAPMTDRVTVRSKCEVGGNRNGCFRA